jgi:rSAM/selenodomain-associated transferase 1
VTRGISEVVIIFARAPEPGRVKTRLVPALGPHAACALHAACVLDVHARHADHAPPHREVVLYRAGDPAAAFWGELPGPQRDQVGADLGERMAAALGQELLRAPKVVILGADSPTLPPPRLDAAFAALDAVPVVLGPAEDGGYYLLGARDRVPPVFHGPAWGSARVLADTCHMLDAAGLRYKRLEDCFDVDRPEDLERLRCAVEAIPHEGGVLPARVAAWLAGPGSRPRNAP